MVSRVFCDFFHFFCRSIFIFQKGRAEAYINHLNGVGKTAATDIFSKGMKAHKFKQRIKTFRRFIGRMADL